MFLAWGRCRRQCRSVVCCISNGYSFLPGWVYRSAWQWPYLSKNRPFFILTIILRPQIFIRQLEFWNVRCTALHGESFACLLFLISPNLGTLLSKSSLLVQPWQFLQTSLLSVENVENRWLPKDAPSDTADCVYWILNFLINIHGVIWSNSLIPTRTGLVSPGIFWACYIWISSSPKPLLTSVVQNIFCKLETTGILSVIMVICEVGKSLGTPNNVILYLPFWHGTSHSQSIQGYDFCWWVFQHLLQMPLGSRHIIITPWFCSCCIPVSILHHLFSGFCLQNLECALIIIELSAWWIFIIPLCQSSDHVCESLHCGPIHS